MSTAEATIQKKLDKEIMSIIRRANIDRRIFYAGTVITFSQILSNKLLLVCVIRTGVPYSFFYIIQQITPFNENDWADFLDLSTKSLHRYRGESRPFRPIQAEKIIEMAEVTNMGLGVFGSIEKFKLWLDTPNYALGSLKPMELLKDSYGKEMVIGELTRINYGILA